MKLLLEKRSKLIGNIEEIMEKAEKECRAFSSEEMNKVNEYKEAINQIDATIKAKEEARDLMTSIKKSASTSATDNEVKSISDEIRALKTD